MRRGDLSQFRCLLDSANLLQSDISETFIIAYTAVCCFKRQSKWYASLAIGYFLVFVCLQNLRHFTFFRCGTTRRC